jgi:LacI family transcriptional regulator
MTALRRSNRDAGQRIGLVEVARGAGVSIATVSRVLNNVGQVRPETRRKVETVARDLDYAPNSFARALASRRSHTLGVIVPSLRGSIFATGVEALQRHAQQRGYSVLLACCDYDQEREVSLARELVARGVDGLVLVGILHHGSLQPMLARREVPYVVQGSYRRRSPHPCIGFDNVAAMERATDYLLELGHRRIGVIAGVSAGNDRVQDRLEGTRRRLARAGLSLAAELLVEARYELGAARAAMARILAAADRPTAVICHNDVLAHGAVLEAQAHGLEVPAALSVIGFDDLEFAEHVRPGLTTMRVPADLMGAKAVDELIARIEHHRRPRPVNLVEPELIVRGSTSPPPG